MSSVTLRNVLILSLSINALTFGIVVRSVHLRGGWQYLRDRFASQPISGSLNSDEVTYRHRQTLFEALPLHKDTVVFVGDSLTAGCEWAEFFPGAVNRGIGGDTSVGLLRRLSSITSLNPRAIFLMIGTNDAMNAHLTPEQTLTNIRAIVAEISRDCPRSSIYVESLLPSKDTLDNLYAREVNRHLPALADGRSVVYVDLYASFLSGRLLSPKFSSDGHHLNGEGYTLWKELIRPYVSAG